MTLQTQDLQRLHGAEVIDRDGEKVGKVDDIFVDEHTGTPEWMTVTTGIFGGRSSFVPLADASTDGDAVRVPWEKDRVKHAPNIDADHQLTQQEEATLYRHYGLEYGESRSGSGLPEGAVGHDVSGPTTDSAMTRSEEELKVGTAKQEAGRVRLRKYVVTENVTQTVPVQHEEVRVEREPVTEANAGAAMDGPAISDEEHEVVLHEEVPVVEKRAVPKERVRLDKETHVDEETVSEDVRKEQIDVDDAARRDS